MIVSKLCTNTFKIRLKQSTLTQKHNKPHRPFLIINIFRNNRGQNIYLLKLKTVDIICQQSVCVTANMADNHIWLPFLFNLCRCFSAKRHPSVNKTCWSTKQWEHTHKNAYLKLFKYSLNVCNHQAIT